MKNNLKSLLALMLVLVMVAALFAGCNNGTETPTEAPTEAEAQETEGEAAPTEAPATEAPAPETEEPAAENDGVLVYATSTFDQKFNPFFYTTAYDGEVVDMVHIGLLAADRGGAVMEQAMGDEGETVDYNGTDYTYRGIGNVEVVQNDDGSVDYNLTMRDDIVFSDGVPATIDDVIFGIYVSCDPTYDGSSTIYALPIEGMDEYRAGLDTLLNLIYNAGRDNTDFTLFTEEQQTAFWEKYDAATLGLAQEIEAYLIEAGYNAEDDDMSAKAGNWGFEVAEGGTIEDFAAAIADAYGPDIANMIETENAGSTVEDLFPGLEEYSDTWIKTGESAPNIAGIQKTGDYSMTIHMTQFDATAIYNMSFVVAPMHYYGDTALYDYDNNMFGFPKGDLSSVKAKNDAPLGAGPYTYEGYANGQVTLKANPLYFKGEPKIKTIVMQESVDSDYVPGIVGGTFDVAAPSINDDTVKAIQDANGGELVGDTLTTVLVDYRGYGYLGINADLVNINGEPGSDASKALRKGFMTLLSVYRDTVINSYYGDRAAVIQYPISNTSWAAPKPADEGFQTAYSTDVDGNPIYTEGMTEEERYAAAKEAAIGFFKAAGFEYDEAAGQFVGVTDTWEIMIPGQGQQDHPAYGIAVAASEVCKELGITLQVNDVGTATWSAALNGNTAMMWAAAWQSTVDPDMTQVYHSSNAHGNGTNSNHYAVDDPALDELIVEGRSSADTEYRKSVYKNAMEIIMDWGCELPLYQRKDCTVFSTARVNIDTIPGDMTPYWGWAAEIENMELK